MRKHKSLLAKPVRFTNAGGCYVKIAAPSGAVLSVRAPKGVSAFSFAAGTSYLEIPKDVTLRLWGGEADGAQGAASCRSSTSGNNGSDFAGTDPKGTKDKILGFA